MCCCAKPNVNGEPGYSWDGQNIGIRPIDPPSLEEGDKLLFDEPGRCGGMDSHCHHYRLVKRFGTELLVRHGGGDDRIRLSLPSGFSFEELDSSARYWILNALYHAHTNGKRNGQQATAQAYAIAFTEGRLKKRKQRGNNAVKVWIKP